MAEHEHVRVAVIGSGFGGLGAAVRLRREGITDFVVLERADSVGGTWRDNSYPGCACDVPSHLYSFSFAPNPDWPRTFSGQRHIRAYLEHVTDLFGLRPHIRLDSEVKLMTWDNDNLRWNIETTRGSLSADVVVSATGPLSDPKIPEIPGLDSFPGKVFHSARWDHDYDLRGKRVAMVGTGASAIQIVPAIQPQVGRLTLFQRTPPWVMPRVDRAISGAERWLHRRLPVTAQARRGLLWGIRELQVQAFTRHPDELGLVERLARRNMTRAVKDPVLRAKLTPDYRIGCKRILLSSSYYPALARPNVDVVTGGLSEVRGSTLVAADGTEAEADAIIFGTGFHVTDMPIAERVVGKEGITLAESWKNGMQALRGAAAAGFPNWMTIIGPNTGLGNSSMILMIESQLNYMADYLRQLDVLGWSPGPHGTGGGRTALDARPAAVESWNHRVQERMKRTVWNTGGCTSWYLDASGRNTTIWPGTTTEFRTATRRVDLAEYEVIRKPSAEKVAKAGEAEKAAKGVTDATDATDVKGAKDAKDAKGVADAGAGEAGEAAVALKRSGAGA
ncbi:flavin-containing monooxygenase [Streptomyces musisoli]|uniref:flavin-containing monooxygenase n=1 Tax=Streptomyces musisoli TaxID=2802280 RepID=UPI001F46D60A|nr:NAD(P)/FAD-dependent oxidoreductase [Streptomyces musisoli]